MKIALILMVLFLGFIFLRFITLAKSSNEIETSPGLENGKLLPCKEKPNCVCSLEKREVYFVEPLRFSGSPEVALQNLKKLILEIDGLSLKSQSDGYMHFTAKSRLFGFIDDLEIQISADNQTIQIRSESRVGYSDLGANRKRVEKIRAMFNTMGSR